MAAQNYNTGMSGIKNQCILDKGFIWYKLLIGDQLLNNQTPALDVVDVSFSSGYIGKL